MNFISNLKDLLRLTLIVTTISVEIKVVIIKNLPGL